MDYETNFCCYCGDECNIHSQACSRCMRNGAYDQNSLTSVKMEKNVSFFQKKKEVDNVSTKLRNYKRDGTNETYGYDATKNRKT